MKNVYLIAFLFVINTNYCAAGNGKDNKKYFYAYQLKDKIVVCDADTKHPVHMTKGFDPYISPDGKKLAFTENSKEGRFVSVIDLNTKKKTRLPIKNNNFYGPIWSPDGKYLAVNIFSGEEWDIGIMDTNNNFKQITRHGFRKSFYSPSFTFDGKKLIAHDMDTIYVFLLDGTIINTIPVDRVAEKYSVSSSTCFIFSPDEKYLYFTASTDDEGIEFPEALFMYDFDNNKTKRLTPIGYCCLRIFVCDAERILFTAYKGYSNTPRIFEINPFGGEMKLFIKNGDFITAARLF